MNYTQINLNILKKIGLDISRSDFLSKLFDFVINACCESIEISEKEDDESDIHSIYSKIASQDPIEMEINGSDSYSTMLEAYDAKLLGPLTKVPKYAKIIEQIYEAISAYERKIASNVNLDVTESNKRMTIIQDGNAFPTNPDVAKYYQKYIDIRTKLKNKYPDLNCQHNVLSYALLAKSIFSDYVEELDLKDPNNKIEYCRVLGLIAKQESVISSIIPNYDEKSVSDESKKIASGE